jgi:hypothetical protein
VYIYDINFLFLFFFLGKFSSFIVIRGSIPLFWHQRKKNDKCCEIKSLKCSNFVGEKSLKPPPVPILTSANMPTMTKHFDMLTKQYGNIVCVNLINQNGGELALCREFEINMDLLPLESVS